MINCIEWIVTIGLLLGLPYWRAPKPVWLSSYAIWLVLLSSVGTWGIGGLALLWLLFLSVATFVLAGPLRRRWLIQPIFNKMHQVLPSMSRTEREALEAGDVWWEKALFCGRPDWRELLAYRKPALTEEEQAFLNNEVNTLCAMVDDWEIMHNLKRVPDHIMDYIKQNNFWGLCLPREFGGKGFSALAHSSIVLKIATRSISVAVTVMVPNSLGPGELIYHYGTDAQKQQYLPALATGKEIPCFALTSPYAGSDAAAMTDTGVICKGTYEGRDVLGLRLNWDKRYITLAPIATVLGLAVKVTDPDHLLGTTEDLGITCCLVPTNLPNVDCSKRHYPMGLAFYNGPTRGKDVFIPLDNVIGGQARIGDGWRMLMECLSAGRGISMPALATAGGKSAYAWAPAYTQARRQFRTEIANFEGVQAVLERIGGFAYMLEAARVMTADAIDQGLKPAVVTAIAKYHMTELNRAAMQDTMDIFAGRGIQVGPSNMLFAPYTATPISITVEGANILTRNLIIFGQGAIRCHPYAYQEMQAVNDADPVKGLHAFDRALCGHLGYKISNYARNIVLGLTGGYFVRVPVTGRVAKYYKQLTRMSAALALTSDMAMLILGGALKRKERLSARLGDILSYLYLASTVLKYFHDAGSPSEELPFVGWSVKYCLHQIQLAFDDFFTNFPYPIIARLLSFIIFPWGQAYHVPSHKLGALVVKQMLVPSALRKRLTEHCYVPDSVTNPIAALEDVFMRLHAAQGAYKALQQAERQGKIDKTLAITKKIALARDLNLLSATDCELIEQAEAARDRVIHVDEFDTATFH